MAQDDYIRTALRVPPDLHKEIHKAADKAGRSFNAEIIGRLIDSFESDPSLLRSSLERQTRLVNVLSRFVVELSGLVSAKSPEVKTLLNLIRHVAASTSEGDFESASAAAGALAAHWQFLDSVAAEKEKASDQEVPVKPGRARKPKS